MLLRIAPHIIRPLRFVLPAIAGAALGAAAAARAVPLRPARRARDPAGDQHARPHPPRRRRSRCSGASATASNIPTAGSTTPGWSCSTRSTPPSAAPRSAPARAARAPSASEEWRLILNAQGRREVATARVLVNAAGPWVGIVAETVSAHAGPAARAARQGQPHRGAASCSITTAATSSRTPTAASSSRCRSRDDFTLIGTTDHEFRRRSRRASAPDADEVRLSLQTRRANISASRRPERRGLGLRRRALALRRRRRQAGGRHARLSSCPRRDSSARRRCSRSTAARSRPTAGSPKRRWGGSRISSTAPRRGPRDAPLPGGDFPWDGVDAHVARAAAPGRS